MFTWNLWWVRTSIWDFGGSPGAYCPMIFAPEGASFLFHTHTWLYGFGSAALQAPWRLLEVSGSPPGPVLTYNFLCVLSTILTGLAAAALCRTFGMRSFLAQLAAGLTIAFCNLRLFSLFGHLNLVGTEFLLASIWAHSRAVWAPGRRERTWWLVGGAFWGLAWLNSLTYGLFAGFFWGYCLVWRWMATRNVLSQRRVVAWAFLSILAWAPLSSCHWVELWYTFHSAEYYVPDLHISRTCDILNFFLPSDYGRYLRPHLLSLRKELGIGGGDGVAFLGWAGLWAAGWACFLAKKERGRELRTLRAGPVLFWGLVAAGGLVLAMGERFTLAGHSAFYLPGRAFRMLPVLGNLRIPERFVIFAIVPLGLVTAWVVQRLRRNAARYRFWAFAAGWTFLFVVDTAYIPDVYTDTDLPPARLPSAVLEAIAVNRPAPAAGGVWTLPVSFADKLPLWWQTGHGRPIPFASMSRVSAKRIESTIARYAFLPSVMSDDRIATGTSMNSGIPEDLVREQVREFVRDYRIRFALVRRDRWPDEEAWMTRYAPGAIRVCGDTQFSVYEFPNLPPAGI